MGAPPRDLERVRRAFQAPEPPTPEHDGRLNAVLVPVFDAEESGHALLYTRRAEGLNHHPGQVSFPGGRVDATDATPLAAALRETHEEVGVPPFCVRVLGHVHDMVTYYGAFIRAYAGHVDGPAPEKPASPDEVAEVFLVPVDDLLDPARYTGRRLEGDSHVVHYFETDAAVVWGITGQITAAFLARAYGWRPPSEARVIRDVSEFLPADL